MKETLEKEIKQIKDYLKREAYPELKKIIKTSHPADLAEIINHLTGEERMVFLNLLRSEEAAQVIPELDSDSQAELLENLEDNRLSRILESMPSDNAADILGDLSEERERHILKLMKQEEAEDVNQLLKYDEDTAGGIMTSDFFALPGEMKAEEAIDKLRQSDIESISYIYIVDKGNHLLGVLSLRRLIVASPQTKLEEIMNTDVIRVTTDIDQEKVANLVRKYNLRALPVVDLTNTLVGRVTVDDVLDVMEEEANEDIYKMAGTDEEELFKKSIFRVARIRLPWLITTLLGTILSAGIILLFKVKIEASVLIALMVFVPAITAMGGNIGIQSSTIVVRGLATGRLDLGHLWKVLFREIRVGALMGLVCGSIVGSVAHLLHGEIVLGIIVAVAMFTAITVAATIGTLAPLALRRFNIDPAIAAGPFVTTSNDITGLLIYFSLATWLLSVLKGP